MDLTADYGELPSNNKMRTDLVNSDTASFRMGVVIATRLKQSKGRDRPQCNRPFANKGQTQVRCSAAYPKQTAFTDNTEPVSARPIELCFVPRKDRANRPERRTVQA